MSPTNHGRLLLDLASDPTTIAPSELPRVILAVVKESYNELLAMQEQFANINTRLCELEETQRENPSIVWFLRNKPKETIPTLLGIVAILGVLYSAIPFDTLLKYLGL